MKKYFEYIGLLSFTLFSFYYTNRVTNIMNSKDPVMISINEYKKTNETCKEGYITKDGVVLGKNGKEVNTLESYSNMQGVGFKETLLVYDEVICKVNLDNVKDNYIINANTSKNMISMLIQINDMNYIRDIISISKEKNIKMNILLDGNILNNNKEYFNKLYNDGYELIYGGNNIEDLKIFLKILKSFDKNYNTYCMSINDKDMDYCTKEDIKKLRTSYYYSNNIYLNTKNNLEKGSFYIYRENKNTLEELSSTINLVHAKNIGVYNISFVLK